MYVILERGTNYVKPSSFTLTLKAKHQSQDLKAFRQPDDCCSNSPWSSKNYLFEKNAMTLATFRHSTTDAALKGGLPMQLLSGF